MGEELGGGGRRGGGATGVQTVAIDKNTQYKFKLLMENKSAVDLKNMTMEYRIFYEQESTGGDGKIVTSPKVVSGVFDPQKLAPKAKKELTTESAVIRKTEYSSNITYGGTTKETERGDLHGIWVRITVKGAGGQSVVREVFDPKSIPNKFKWEKLPDS